MKDNFWNFICIDTNGKGCWRWMGNLSRGYGKFKADGVNYRAHRYSYQHLIGDIPDGMHVMHRCDNPSCVNPDHLTIGTHYDNMTDMVHKGRARGKGPRGSRNGASKFNEDQIINIRHQYDEGNISQAKLARKYDVTSAAINRIIHRQVWTHV